MIKYLAIAMALAACSSGDKCSKVYDKLAPVFEKEMKGEKKMDKAKEIERCKDELKNHPDREAAMDCILALPGTPSMGDLMACESKRDNKKDTTKDDTGKVTEASLQLNKIGKNAKRVFAETSAFPIAKAPLTPATDCCKGPSGKCPVDATAWTIEPWKTFEFTVDEPHQFRYSYESTDGKSFTATAVGDPDCSGKPVTYTLNGTLDATGNPSVNLIKPN
jgi:hypothetical protein